MKTIAIIPARGGSKRIANKNIKEFFNKPIISYSIKTALESNCFEGVYVSTDSKKIAEIAKDFGAKVPFMREDKISDDLTDTLTVIKDAIKKIELSFDFDNVCCLYATAPLLQKEYLIEGNELCKRNKSKFIISVAEFNHPIQRSFQLSETSSLIIQDKKNLRKRTQDLERYYHDAGQFYFGHKSQFLKSETLISSDAIGITIPKRYVCDIDRDEDWELAESLYGINNSRSKIQK